MFATEYESPEVAFALIEGGCNLNLCDNEGWTILMSACRYGQFSVAKKLIEHGAKINIENINGRTAVELLWMKMQESRKQNKESYEVLCEMVECGCDLGGREELEEETEHRFQILASRMKAAEATLKHHFRHLDPTPLIAILKKYVLPSTIMELNVN